MLNRLSYGVSIFSQRSRIRTELILYPKQAGRHLPLSLERVTGFEPVSSAWKAEALPLDDTRRIKKYSVVLEVGGDADIR